MATINIKKTIPAKITNLVITPAVGGRVLTWDKHDDDTYEVWTSTTNDVSGATLLAKVEANTFAATNLDTTLSHFFWVRAVNPVGTVGAFTQPNCSGAFFNTLYVGVFESGSTSTSVDYVQAQVWYTTAAGVATSVGPSYFTTTATNSTFGSEPWVNPDNARVSDGTYATVTSSGSNQDLLFKLSDLGVPNDALVTGVQVTLRGKSTSYTASVLQAYLLDTLGFSVSSVPFASFTADSTDQTVQVGSSTSTFGLDVFGAQAVLSQTTSVGSGSVSSSSGTAAFSDLTAYGVPQTAAYVTFSDFGPSSFVSGGGYVCYSISSPSVTAGQEIQVWLYVNLYDNTTSSYVGGVGSSKLLYINANGTAFGNLTGVENIAAQARSGFGGHLIIGHSYTLSVQLTKKQITGTPTIVVASSRASASVFSSNFS